MSQAVSASQVRSQAGNIATYRESRQGSKVRKTTTEAHRAISVRKEMVKVPLMKLKFDLQMTRGQTRPRHEDGVVERYQSVVANPANWRQAVFAMER